MLQTISDQDVSIGDQLITSHKKISKKINNAFAFQQYNLPTRI